MDILSQLVEALRCLPGVGPKSAQRMVYHLLHQQRHRGVHLAACLEEAMTTVTSCARCNNYTTYHLCNICQDKTRQAHMLCVVESPSDVVAIEQSNSYKGYYFVLMNKISPLDGIGPDDIHLPQLKNLIIADEITEVILALSPTVEGQTTMHFIRELLINTPAVVSQLARGIPTGGELEFLDSNTIGSAFKHRSEF